MGSRRSVRRLLVRQLFANRPVASASSHKRWFLRLEPLEQREMPAVADGHGRDLNGRLVLFPTDPMEGNNSRRIATEFSTLLDSHVNPTIDPHNGGAGLPQDEDWYRYVAPRTGTFRFQLDYQTIGVANDATYYVRVVGATAEAVNVYDVDLIDVDTFGPQVTEVAITDHEAYNLFTQKQGAAFSFQLTAISLWLGICARMTSVVSAVGNALRGVPWSEIGRAMRNPGAPPTRSPTPPAES